jgi:hypothetical protein
LTVAQVFLCNAFGVPQTESDHLKNYISNVKPIWCVKFFYKTYLVRKKVPLEHLIG